MHIIHKNIQDNAGLAGKRMTEAQLMLLLQLVSEYDFQLPDMTDWTIKKASKVIDLILWHKEYGKMKPRKKPYNMKVLLKRFIRKYPELYDAITSRHR